MTCKHTLRNLDCYLDGELSPRLTRRVERHLMNCRACAAELERIRELDHLLEASAVPSAPPELAARIMAKARGKVWEAVVPTPVVHWYGWPTRWLGALPLSMRVAAFATSVLACLIGFSMGGGFRGDEQRLPSGPQTDLAGLQWFDPAPPGSVASAYLAVVSPPMGERDAR